ncbi:hypothetical protein QOZ80_8AG0615090 [Eleusine coracana subsp. coracana]|nr:hypothetical protein QOZ80_8AG0615090 [Eleusine coracana subsp. coracana]
MAQKGSRRERRRRRNERLRNGSIALLDKRKDSPCQQQQEDGDPEAAKRMRNSLPELPEDIWRHIHSLLPTRDAALLACQSRSFLRSWRCHPILTLNKIILGSSPSARPKNFISIIDRILSNHSGNGIKVFNLRLFGIFDACPYLDTWLQIAVKPGIEELTLELCGRCEIKYSVPCSLLSDGVQNSIRYLRLAFCSFRPTAELGPLINLTSLSLYLVNISGEELECFLLNSPALEWLDLCQCNKIIHLKIPCVMQQLSCLDVSSCSELRVIESEAQNLSRFSLKGGSVENVSLGETLQMKSFCMDCPELVCYARTEMPASMPNLEALVISLEYERVNTPILPTKFMFLKYLSIYLDTDWSFCPSYDHFSLASFLDASPSLETLILDVTQHRMKHESVFRGSLQLRQMPEQHHGCLKTVKITGFSSAKGLVELTCYILKNAESLECLTLDTLCGTNRCYLENSILSECDPMSEGILKEAPRAVKAIKTFIADKVPPTAYGPARVDELNAAGAGGDDAPDAVGSPADHGDCFYPVGPAASPWRQRQAVRPYLCAATGMLAQMRLELRPVARGGGTGVVRSGVGKRLTGRWQFTGGVRVAARPARRRPGGVHGHGERRPSDMLISGR